MRTKVIFITIVLIAFLLRFFNLSTNPPALTWDEAAWGYNAYSLGQDGKDEFGRFLPITYLESFGDYKPPLYAYLSIIPVKVFGMNEFSTRFISALFGTLTVCITFFLVKEIFGKEKNLLALLSTGILAISPWHILLSRAAFEANVANFFIVLGIYLFFVSKRKRSLLLVCSVISFIASMYTFNSARIVAPLLFIILCIFSYKQMFVMKKQVIIAGIIGMILIAPLGLFLQTPAAKLRFNEVNIFSDISIIKTINQEVANDHNSLFSKGIHNRRLVYLIAYVKHYLDNLSPGFLFITGDGNPKFSIQSVGQLYLWEIPFLILGVFFLFRKREGYWWFIPVWLLVGIIPAGVARETPHALRIESSLPTFQILTAYGLVTCYLFLTRIKIKQMHLSHVYIGMITVLLMGNVMYFLYLYFVQYPSTYSGEWQYGYKQSIAYVQKEKDHYKNVIITNALGRPYIYYLFYTKFSPETFRKNAVIRRDPFGFVHVDGFDKYLFVDNMLDVSQTKDNLYIGTQSDIPQNAHVLKTIALLNGKPALYIYTF